MPITQSWREYYEVVNEPFIQRLDRVIDEMNQNASVEERIDWEACGVDEESENQRRERVRSKFIKCGFSTSTITRWIPDVKIDDEGTWVEVSHGKYGLIDPSIASGEEETRENVFQFCGILELTLIQTEKILKRVFFCRPFNPKDYRELTYLFFAKKSRDWYKRAELFLEENQLTKLDETVEESLKLEKGKNCPAGTTVNHNGILYVCLQEHIVQKGENPAIESAIWERKKQNFTKEIPTSFSTETALADYIRNNALILVKQNQYVTALERIKEHVKNCWKDAVYEILNFGVQNLKDINIDKKYDENDPKVSVLVHVILGHLVKRGTSVNKYDSALIPPPVSKNFPTPTNLNNIINGKERGMDKIRKVLVLLSFYRWCARTGQFDKDRFEGNQIHSSEQKQDENYSTSLYKARHKELLNNCVATMNLVLKNANLPELSENDLYDALFLFAAGTDNPLRTFRDIMFQSKPTGE